jgi:hypothetical protein
MVAYYLKCSILFFVQVKLLGNILDCLIPLLEEKERLKKDLFTTRTSFGTNKFEETGTAPELALGGK